ncbi:MAG TPA: protein-L-isoaspartate(D-aspartate) O-methyltransferase [Fibrobacteria bacterium]|jgi:protein-L-isoaspartate(D-aspartate) O-methyltransferase|nr:protein-L-isoaspartate(D-aspartate) O-methyltransferase [Fibrobacteria bacterium]
MDAVTQARHRMADAVFRRLGIEDDFLRRALEEVPRHAFLDSAQHHSAYEDKALPIGMGQTISQPTIVAMMTHALAPNAGDKILEIGTGSGYQTAVLARYTPRLHTIERVAELSRRAQGVLESLGLRNVIYRIGDGSLGWESRAPYDRILVAAGAPVAPEALKRQLADGGRLVIPVGGRDTQRLLAIDRVGESFVESDMGECRFVPLLGAQGFAEDAGRAKGAFGF